MPGYERIPALGAQLKIPFGEHLIFNHFLNFGKQFLSYPYSQSRRGNSVQTQGKTESHLFLGKNEFCLSFPTS